MLIDEIYAMEQANESGIQLVRDRKFFQAYERSAFRFVKLFRGYRVHGRFVKKISAEVVYLGFPDTVLSEIERDARSSGYLWKVVEPDKHFEITGLPPLDGFDAWKSSVLGALSNGKSPVSAHKIPQANLFQAYKEAYDFALYLCRLTGKFHRNCRFGLGENLRAQAVELLLHLQLAIHDAAAFDPALCYALSLKMQIELRLLQDLRQVTPKQWVFANGGVGKITSLLRLGSDASRSAGESLSESSNPLSPDLFGASKKTHAES